MVPAPLPTSLGEFRVDSLLGEGGSGMVYEATWGPRKVALKVLHPSLVANARVRAQFLAEAQRLQTITHASVVKVLAVGELPDGRPYLAMERLEGETLAAVLARGPLEMTRALDLFGELCAAVGTLHDQGLIHRDLKPENVFIVAGKHAVLLDFGIAKELDAPASTTTMDGGVRGTPAYMAPERFFGQPASVATDLYELAVTLYAMLAGRLPWDDLADPEARLAARPLVEHAEVPEELDVEIRKALSTRAQNRPASARALLEAVRTAAGTGSTAASSTARMRPATDAAAPKTTQPWFADRQKTTDRGKTPLAWAPTQLASAATPARKKRSAWIVTAIALAGLGALAGTALWWRAHRDPASETHALATPTVALPSDAPITGAAALTTAHDPWSGRALAEHAVGPLPTHGPELSDAAARAELAAAIPHLPVDTSVVAGALVGQLRRDARFTPMFDKLAASPKVALLGSMVPPCVRSLVSGSEWFVFGSAGLTDNSSQGTLIIRGRWARADVEQCFAGQSEALTMTDGAKLLQLPEIGWLDFLDEHTVYISVRQDLAAAQVHANVRAGKGLTVHARELVAALPADRALLFVVDGKRDAAWPSDALPRGADLSAWFRPERDQASLGVVMAMRDDAEAKQVERKLRPEIDSVFSTANASVAKMVVTRTGKVIVLRGQLSSLMLGIVSAAIP